MVPLEMVFVSKYGAHLIRWKHKYAGSRVRFAQIYGGRLSPNNFFLGRRMEKRERDYVGLSLLNILLRRTSQNETPFSWRLQWTSRVLESDRIQNASLVISLLMQGKMMVPFLFSVGFLH